MRVAMRLTIAFIILGIYCTVPIEIVHAAVTSRYWYSQDARWRIKASAVNIVDGAVDLVTASGKERHFQLGDLSDYDRLEVRASILLAASLDRLRDSPFTAVEAECSEIATQLSRLGVSEVLSLSWIQETVTSARKERNALHGRLAFMPGRWVSIRGMQYPIVFVEESAKASGFAVITVRDSMGHDFSLDRSALEEAKLIDSAVAADVRNRPDWPLSVFLLPRFWSQSTSRDPSGSQNRILALRGPRMSFTESVKHELVYDEPTNLWTTGPVKLAFRDYEAGLALQRQAADALQEIEYRWNIFEGDRLLEKHNYSDAWEHYNSGIQFSERQLKRSPLWQVHLRRAVAGLQSRQIDYLETDLRLVAKAKGNVGDVGDSVIELRARAASLAALDSPVDETAVRNHQEAVQLARTLSDSQYLVRGAGLPKPIIRELRFLRSKGGNQSLRDDLRSTELIDRKERADKILLFAFNSYSNGAYDLAIPEFQRAVEISDDQMDVRGPAYEYIARMHINLARASLRWLDCKHNCDSALVFVRKIGDDRYLDNARGIISVVRAALLRMRATALDKSLDSELSQMAMGVAVAFAEKNRAEWSRMLREANAIFEPLASFANFGVWDGPTYEAELAKIGQTIKCLESIAEVFIESREILAQAGEYARNSRPPVADTSNIDVIAEDVEHAAISHQRQLSNVYERRSRFEYAYSALLQQTLDYSGAFDHGLSAILEQSKAGAIFPKGKESD